MLIGPGSERCLIANLMQPGHLDILACFKSARLPCTVKHLVTVERTALS